MNVKNNSHGKWWTIGQHLYVLVPTDWYLKTTAMRTMIDKCVLLSKSDNSNYQNSVYLQLNIVCYLLNVIEQIVAGSMNFARILKKKSITSFFLVFRSCCDLHFVNSILPLSQASFWHICYVQIFYYCL